MKSPRRRATAVIRIDPETNEHRRFRSIRTAVDELNRAMVAKGGIARDYLWFAGNISRAANRNGMAYQFRWKRAKPVNSKSAVSGAALRWRYAPAD